MNTLKKLAVSLLIAWMVVEASTLIAYAQGPYRVSEKTISPVYTVAVPAPLTTANCFNSTCKWLYQVKSGVSDTWRWADPPANVYNWWVFRPYIGQAAVIYHWFTYDSKNKSQDSWYITVDQSKHKGTWAYLGFSDYLPNARGRLQLNDLCVPKYSCGGLKVYWDEMQYDTKP
ncbi:MAG: hypothetical protein WA821_02495 [Anaerolineales bacterium]